MADIPLHIYSHTDCLGHLPGLGHPDNPARLRAVLDLLENGNYVHTKDPPLPPKENILGALAWVHSREYLDRLEEACRNAPLTFDSQDCALGPNSFQALLASSGLALQAALDLASGRFRRGFVATRPPAHHAGREKASGYCFLNTTALAAEVLCRASGGRVLIVDFDAHHGNGTQEIFFKRGDIGYLSIHEYPAFPGSGAGDELGEGPGLDTTLNIPLAAGAEDETVCAALEHGLDQMIGRLRPAALVISAGFSGHADDPLSEWKLSEKAYARMTHAIVEASGRWSEGRILSLLEGGYEPKGLVASLSAHLRTLQHQATQSTEVN